MVLTLFNLENSRAFRVLWLANELDIPIKSRNYARVEGKKAASNDCYFVEEANELIILVIQLQVPELAKDSGYKLGKSPCLIEDDFEGSGEALRIVESANCMQ